MHMLLSAFIVVAVMAGTISLWGNYSSPDPFWEEFGVQVYSLSDLVVDGEVSADTDSLVIRVVSGKSGKFSVYVTCPNHEDKYSLGPVSFRSDAKPGAGKIFEGFIVTENPPSDSISVLVSYQTERREFILVKLKEEVGLQVHLMEVR